MVAAAIIIAAGITAYSNSFRGPFILDDGKSIPENLHIRKIWPIWAAMKTPSDQTVSGRPVLSLSLAINYQISQKEVWSYHVVNVAIHIAAGLVLFGIVRRTLVTDRLKDRFGKVATILGLICALIWLVHPLQTQAVTYIIQRAESLMGLFYLLTLYCAIRGFASRRRTLWYSGAMVSCALGMGTKEVMATGPIMVLLYDRVFVTHSLKDTFRRHLWIYIGLAFCWVVLAVLLLSAPRAGSAGFNLGVAPLEYAMTQCKVVLRYLKLAFWPHPLVLDYSGDPTPQSFGDFAPAGMGVLLLLVGTILGLHYRPSAGFLGAWFFGILAPTSSFVPLLDPAFEHRMYLPLAAIVVGAVTGVYFVSSRLTAAKDPRAAIVMAIIPAAVVIMTLGILTFKRNHDYRSAISIWEDTIDKRPNNYRAYNCLGTVYWYAGDCERAIDLYDKAIALKPDFAFAYNSRGAAYASKRNYEQAILDFEKAIELNPRYAPALYNLSIIQARARQTKRR